MSLYVPRPGDRISHDITDYPEGIVLPVDKPWRWTSADVIRKLKWAAIKHFRKRNLKVGHAGTLDPLATGVLLVCIGPACKRAQELQDHDKEYLAGILQRSRIVIHRAELLDFQPGATQAEAAQNVPVPEGEGEPPQRNASSRIRVIEPLEELPLAMVRIACSKGTYIRAFARDLGEALGSGAHLDSLVRTRTGEYTKEGALSLEDALNLLAE